MNKKFALFCIAAVGMVSAVSPLIAQKMDGSKINSVTMKWQTPHHDWAPKFAGGQLKVLYCTSIPREAVEIAQRADITHDVISFHPRHLGDIFGYTRNSDGFYGNIYEGTGEADKQKDLVEKVNSGKYQVVVISGVDFRKVGDDVMYALFKAVKDKGLGLVMLRCRFAPNGLFRKKVPNNVMAMVQTGAADSVNYSYDPIAGKTVMLRTSPNEAPQSFQFGKGRILVYGMGTRHLIHAPFLYYTPRWWGIYESAFPKVFRSLLWAAGRLPANNVKFVQKGSVAELTGLTGTTTLRLRNEWNKVIKTQTVKGASAKFAIPQLPSGAYSLDTICSGKNGVTNVGLFTVKVDNGVKGSIVAADDTVKGFDPIRATVKLSRPLKNATMKIYLADSPDQRIWWQKTVKVPAKAEFPVVVANYFMPNLAAFLNIEISENGRQILKLEKPFYFPTWVTERMPLYHDNQWEYNPGGSDLIRSLAEVQVMGFGTSYNRIDGDRPDVQSTWLRNCRLQSWIASFNSVPAKKGNKDRISVGAYAAAWEKRAAKMTAEDLKFIEKDQILYRSKATKRIAQLKVQAQFNNKNLQKYPLYFYQTGNECGLRQFENQGYTKEDKAAFALYLKDRYGTIANLNRLWGRSYKDFASVPNMRMREAQQKKMYPEYRAHFDYASATFIEYCHSIADEIHRLAPHEKKIGVDGAWSANGFNMEELFKNKNINYWAPYVSKHIGMQQLRCIRPDIKPFLVWGWIMKDTAMPSDPWFSLMITPCYESSWYISGPSIGGIHTTADYRPYNDILQKHLNDLREGQAQLLNVMPLTSDKIAIWQNDASDRAVNLSDPRIPQIGDSTLPFYDWCYKHGLNFEYIFPHNINELKKYKVLLMPAAVALNEKDVKKIKEFAANGGLVIADINPGLMNDSYGMFNKSIASELFGNWNPKKIAGIKEYQLNLDKTLKGQRIVLQGSVGGTPGIEPFRVQKIGKGYTILLNFTLGKASLCTTPQKYDAFMKAMFAVAGIKPAIKTTGLPDGSVIRSRRIPGLEVLGVTNRTFAEAGRNGGNASIKLPAKKYVYAVKKGFMGHTDTINFRFAPPFRVFSLFDKPQKAPVLNIPATAQPGKPVMVDLRSFPEKTVLLLQVRDSKGKLIRFRNEAPSHEVIVVDGKTKKFPFCFAYTDAKGRYEVSLMNVATGLKTVKKITLK